MHQDPVIELIRTLIACGFHLDSIHRVTSSASVFDIHKFDTFETRIDYSLLVASDTPPKAAIASFIKHANRTHSNPIGLGTLHSVPFKCFTLEVFYRKLGGPLNSSLIFHPELHQILVKLGLNKLPAGFEGEPEDLLEEYVKDCLQFILNSPVRRYGRDRAFETLPDGVALGENNLVVQFDSKAYSRGYAITADDIRRFASYVNTFNQAYASILGKVFVFLVVTTNFKQGPRALERKSADLYAKCQTRLCCLTTTDLGTIVKNVLGNHRYRSSVDWRQVFSKLRPTAHDVRSRLIRIKKDRLV